MPGRGRAPHLRVDVRRVHAGGARRLRDASRATPRRPVGPFRSPSDGEGHGGHRLREPLARRLWRAYAEIRESSPAATVRLARFPSLLGAVSLPPTPGSLARVAERRQPGPCPAGRVRMRRLLRQLAETSTARLLAWTLHPSVRIAARCPARSSTWL